jgi:hypothetical protein
MMVNGATGKAWLMRHQKTILHVELVFKCNRIKAKQLMTLPLMVYRWSIVIPRIGFNKKNKLFSQVSRALGVV